MAVTPGDSSKQKHRAPKPTRPRGPTKGKVPVKPSKNDTDSLSSILAGIQKLADDLKQNPAAQGYAPQADSLADRLKRVMTGKG